MAWHGPSHPSSTSRVCCVKLGLADGEGTLGMCQAAMGHDCAYGA
jgi:hypothetical protein